MAAVINTDEDPLRQISGPGFGEAWEALYLQRGCTEANRSRRSAVNFGSGDLVKPRAVGRPIGPPPRWNFQ
jgi:hypothetical protein